ncbi:hypothetical protein GCM10027612_13280 [Microbispora bryophytorum subsp. camponoti]
MKKGDPRRGESGGRLAVRLWGVEPVPYNKKALNNGPGHGKGSCAIKPRTPFRIERHIRILPDHERYVEHSHQSE